MGPISKGEDRGREEGKERETVVRKREGKEGSRGKGSGVPHLFNPIL